MNSVLNLNIIWTAASFLNYIEHSFSDTVADLYDSLSEDEKNTLRVMETTTAMFRNLCKELKLNSSKLNLIPKKKQENGKEILTT